MKTLLKWLGIALLGLVLLGWLPAWLGAWGLYAQRYAATFTTNPLDPAYRWYRPMETVPGADHGPLPVAPPGESPFAPGVLERAADWAGSHASDSLVVLHGGRVVFERYWNGKGPDSPFVAHSMTKTLNAILVGHAIAEGRIGSVDDPAYFYLAEWDDPAHRAIRIRDLLNMASGLAESYDFAPWSARMQRTMGTDIVAANLATPVAGPPRVKFSHINPPPQLLGILIERATGRRFAEYLAEKFWQPIGAHDAQLFLDRPGGMVHTDCCMWTTIRDWARVGEALRTGGLLGGRRVIPEGWVEQMIAPSSAYLNYGMLTWLGNTWEPLRRYDPDMGDAFANRHSEPFAAGTFWLDGLHGQRVWVVPTRELVIVRTGTDHPDWDEAFLPNLLVRGLPP